MTLLALDDPVFVVDLTPAALEQTRRAFERIDEEPGPARAAPSAPERLIRAVALVFDWEADPVLVPVEPTRDTVALDATARLLRAALVTGARVADLASCEPDLLALHAGRRLPAFVYEGLPPAIRGRVPPRLADAVP